jgi:hypothetical protein
VTVPETGTIGNFVLHPEEIENPISNIENNKYFGFMSVDIELNGLKGVAE